MVVVVWCWCCCCCLRCAAACAGAVAAAGNSNAAAAVDGAASGAGCYLCHYCFQCPGCYLPLDLVRRRRLGDRNHTNASRQDPTLRHGRSSRQLRLSSFSGPQRGCRPARSPASASAASAQEIKAIGRVVTDLDCALSSSANDFLHGFPLVLWYSFLPASRVKTRSSFGLTEMVTFSLCFCSRPFDPVMDRLACFARLDTRARIFTQRPRGLVPSPPQISNYKRPRAL